LSAYFYEKSTSDFKHYTNEKFKNRVSLNWKRQKQSLVYIFFSSEWNWRCSEWGPRHTRGWLWRNIRLKFIIEARRLYYWIILGTEANSYVCRVKSIRGRGRIVTITETKSAMTAAEKAILLLVGVLPGERDHIDRVAVPRRLVTKHVMMADTCSFHPTYIYSVRPRGLLSLVMQRSRSFRIVWSCWFVRTIIIDLYVNRTVKVP